MTSFQIIMFFVAAFFAYKVYEHIQTIDEDAEPLSATEPIEVKKEPTAEELVEKADEAYLNDEIDKAKQILEEAVQKFPNFAEAMNKLAFILAKEGDNENAQKYYEKSLMIEPNDDMTHNALAILFASEGKVIQAQEHYKKALDIDDNYEVTWFNFANLMAKIGENEKAKEMYTKAIEINPDFQEAKDELEKLK